MFYLYQKLGYAEVGQRTSSMLHIDLFSRRLERTAAGIPGDILTRVPRQIRDYREADAWELLKQSKTLVHLNVGGTAAIIFQRHLRRSGARLFELHCPLFFHCRKNKYGLPLGVVENRRDSAGRDQLHRIVINVPPRKDSPGRYIRA